MTQDDIYEHKKNDIPSAAQDVKHWTIGEKLFDGLTYVGLQGVANAALSIVFADWVHNNWNRPNLPSAQQEQLASKKVYNLVYKGAEKFAKTLEPFLGKSIATIENGKPVYKGAIKYSRYMFQGGVLGIGGWAMLPLIKVLEDNKIPIVNSINRQLTSDTDDDNKTRSNLGDDTKQTWLGLLGGRSVAFVMPLAIGAALLDPLSKRTGEDFLLTLSNFSRDKLKLKPEKFIRNMSVVRGKEWSYQLAGEVFYTAIGVATLYVVSKAISRAMGSKGDTADPTEARITQSVMQEVQAEPGMQETEKRVSSTTLNPNAKINGAKHYQTLVGAQEIAR